MTIRRFSAPLFLLLLAQSLFAQCGPLVPHTKQSRKEIVRRQASEPEYVGTVIVTAIISETGRTTCVDVTQSAGSELDKQAREVIKDWEFEPAMKNGKAVTVQVSIPLDFVREKQTGKVTLKRGAWPAGKSQ